MNHDPLYPTVTAVPMPQSPDDETIYGYPIRDLVVFAEYCRVAGVEPKDLKDFVGDISAVYEVLQKAMDEHLARCLKECLRPIQSPGGGAKEG